MVFRSILLITDNLYIQIQVGGGTSCRCQEIENFLNTLNISLPDGDDTTLPP